jgi:cytidylate kinase
MAAITISRQTGSLGGEIAGLVAGQLGFRLVWRELINQAARRAGTPEIALAAIDELGLFDLSPSPKAYLAYRDAVKQVVEELAEVGEVVIIGRAGQMVLKDNPSVLHVRIVAPTPVRAERIAQRTGVSLEAAFSQIEASDQYRMRYIKRFYKVRWDNPDLYDLVINTARVSSKTAAGLICQALMEKVREQELKLSSAA